MGLYALRCPKCGFFVERRVTYKESGQQACEATACGAKLEREISVTQPGRSDGQYRMGAYMKDGSFVPGHFGVTSKNYRGLN